MSHPPISGEHIAEADDAPPARRLPILSIVAWAAALALAAGALWTFRSESRHLPLLHQFLSTSLFGAVWLVLLDLTVSAWFSAEVLRAFDLRLRTWEWFFLGMVTTLGNSVAPMRGGIGLRAGYLWSRHRLKLGDFAVGMAGLVLILLWSIGGVAAVGLTMLYVYRGLIIPSLWAVVGVCWVVGAILCLMPPRLTRPSNRWMAKIVDMINGWRTVTQHPGLLLRLMIIATIKRLIEGAVYLMIFQAMGVLTNYWAVLTVTSLATLAGTMGLLPGALVVYEAGITLTASMCGITASDALTAALVFRFLTMAWLALLGTAGSAYLTVNLRGSPCPAPSAC